MARFTPLIYGAVVELLLAVGLLAAAMPTRGWMVYKGLDVGLFTVSSGDIVGSRRLFSDVFGEHNDDFLATIILEGLGAALLVLATGCLLLFLATLNNRILALMLVYMVASFVSGVLTVTAILFFRFNITYDFDTASVGYSWYLSLVASILILSSFGSMASALKRGEVKSKAPATATSANTHQMQYR